jgi:hypothetical protein
MAILLGFLVWLWLLISLAGDLFRRHDVGALTKVAWIVGVIVFPFVGVLAYLALNHRGIAERKEQREWGGAEAYMHESGDRYTYETPPKTGTPR